MNKLSAMVFVASMGLFASCATKNANGEQPFDLNLIASRTEATVGPSEIQGKDVLNIESESAADGICCATNKSAQRR